MYGITKEVTQKPSTPFPVGMDVDKVQITKVEFQPTGDYGPQLKFTLERASGDAVSQLQDWRTFPTEQNVVNRLRAGEDSASCMKREQEDLNSVIRHYFGSAGDIDKLEQEVGLTENATEFGEKIVSVLSAHLKTAGCPDLYAKTYRNDKGYARLSKYPPFLQRMSEGESNLKYSQWEIDQNTKATETPENGPKDESGEGLDFLD